jgi:hypothetical protein
MRVKQLKLGVRLLKDKKKNRKNIYLAYTETLDMKGRVKNTYDNVIQIKDLGYHGLDWAHGN